MDVSKYFNQTALYKRYKKTLGNGKKAYEDGVNVKLRLEQTRRKDLTEAGGVQTINGFFMTKLQNIQIGDIFEYNGRAYEVVSTEEVIDKKARFIYTEGDLK